MMRGLQKLAARSWTDPSVLAGGAAGLGAMSLTNSMMQSGISAKGEALKSALGEYAAAKGTPLMAGAITALLVGAMVASRMRQNRAQTFNRSQYAPPPMPMRPKAAPGDSPQDFLRGERVPFATPYTYA
jgi:hypothetical protein